MTGFILKIIIFSAGISVLIKYGGRLLPIPPTEINALIAIFLPSLIMALALWRRSKNNN